jgi:hypothetical protein
MKRFKRGRHTPNVLEGEISALKEFYVHTYVHVDVITLEHVHIEESVLYRCTMEVS